MGSGLGLAPKDDKIIEGERGLSGRETCRKQGGGLGAQTSVRNANEEKINHTMAGQTSTCSLKPCGS